MLNFPLGILLNTVSGKSGAMIEHFMRTFRCKLFWALLATMLGTSGTQISAQSTNQNFSLTVTGTGTETWYSDDLVYKPIALSVSSPKGNTDGIIYAEANFVAPLGGVCTFSYHISFSASWGGADVLIKDVTTLTEIMYNCGGNYSGVPFNQGATSFNVTAGHNYYIFVSAYGHINRPSDPGSGSGSSQISLNFPDHYQSTPHTATRTATMNSSGTVNASENEKWLGGFSAPPQPQNGGTISGTSYALTWNNTNVVVFFSDTRTKTTTNPNASIVAVVPGAYGGTPQSIPGHIFVQHFDSGGEGIAYHDTDSTNHGDFRMSEGVDVSDDEIPVSGFYRLYWTAPGEWVNYTINASHSGFYSIILSAGKIDGASTNHISIDGTNITGQLTISNSGSWNYQSLRKDGVYISSGNHVLRLAMDTCGPDWGNGNFNGIDVVDYGDPQIQTTNANFGIRTNRFGFIVTGLSNQVVVIEACTNVFNSNWVPLQTNTMGTNAMYFYDAKWTNYGKRFYRVSMP